VPLPCIAQRAITLFIAPFLEAVTMTTDKREPTRLELYKAGKIEERRSPRRPHILEHVEPEIEEEKQQRFVMRPEMIAIGLFILLLLILTLIGIK
jgi:hypothetical protein